MTRGDDPDPPSQGAPPPGTPGKPPASHGLPAPGTPGDPSGGSSSGPSGPGGPGGARLTSRAAVLAVVMCAIALSLAYPVREYVAQRQQIDQLVAEQQMMQDQLKGLSAERAKLHDPAYIEQLAEQGQDMCFPGAQCYVIDNGQSVLSTPRPPQPGPAPWYSKLWHSVKQADESPGK